MPVNRNALIRYKTIDKCLQNKYRQWTLDNLIEACSDALYEYEGIDSGVSKRTVQADIQVMRSDKLGYNAPIVVDQKKYYRYEDEDYSITNIPLTDQDLGTLSEAVEFMKQFQGFSHFKELDGMVQKLEDHIYSQRTHSPSVIDMEKNEDLKGLDYLNRLYQAIIKKEQLRINYQSFKAREAANLDVSPYLLKEYRNRWFLVCRVIGRNNMLFLALDRMNEVERSDSLYHEDPTFNAKEFFKNAIGVSVSPTLEPIEVRLFVNQKQAPYVETKPLHSSQEVVERHSHGIVVSLRVQHNFELEKEIMAFGEAMKVISPPKLKRRILERMSFAVENYQTELSPQGLQTAKRKMMHKGYAILNKVYTKREIAQINRAMADLEQDERSYAHRDILTKKPELKQLLFNENLQRIVQEMDKKAFMVKSLYFDKPQTGNWFVSWHQDVPIAVSERKEVEGYEKWTLREGIHSVRPPLSINQNMFTIRIHLDDTSESNGALKVLPGSHKKQFSHEEMKLITENAVEVVCSVGAGGVQLMSPLLLHSSGRTKNQKRRRVLHLEFASVELDGGLEWRDRVRVQSESGV